MLNVRPALKANAVLCITAGLAAALLAGCGGGGGSSSGAPPPTPVYATLAGTIDGGRQPVAGATVTAWAANPTPDAPATKLGMDTTATDGSFDIAFSSEPAAGQLVYVTATGGNAGAGENAAISLMTVAGGYCSGAGCGFPASVDIDARSTIYAAYALAAFADDSTGSVNVSGASPGLPNAGRTFTALVDPATAGPVFVDGSQCTGSGGEPEDCATLRKMNTLANYLAACVNSDGAGSATCSGLLGQTGGSDTLQATLALATQASVRNDGAGLFGLSRPPAVFTPVLSSAPADWTLTLQHTGGGLNAPAGIAVDAGGKLWIANNFTDQDSGSVTELSPTGSALSPASGYTDPSLAGPIAVAVDQSGNVWVANYSQGGGKAVTEFDQNGNPLSGSAGYTQDILGPAALAVTQSGEIWVANSGNSSLTRLDASGSPDMTVKQQGGLGFPVSLATDSLGDVWVADQGGDRVSEFTSAGMPLSGSGGYTGGGISGPAALAVDLNDNVWVADHLSGVAALIGGDTPPASCPANPTAGDTGCPFSPVGGFTGGGVQSPASVAVDGANHIWFSNYLSGSVSEFDDTGAALSPGGGYQADGHLLLPYGLAVDPSGNLWVTNYAADSVTEFVGIAGPVNTPLVGP